MHKVKCPEDCHYRQRDAPFCGFCMRKILMEQKDKGQEEKKEGDRDGS